MFLSGIVTNYKNNEKATSWEIKKSSNFAWLTCACIGGLVGVLSVLWVLWVLYLFLVASTTTVVQQLPSPDGRFIATYFINSGGGAAGWMYERVSLRQATNTFNKDDYIFQVSHSEATLSWQDNRTLRVTYPADTNVQHQESNKDGITILYRKK